MNASKKPRSNKDKENLIVYNSSSDQADFLKIEALSDFLQAGDLLVVNDAATLPSSHIAETLKGEIFELRLASAVSENTWKAIAMGSGNWHNTTESRGLPPEFKIGDIILIAGKLNAKIREISFANRFLTIEFENEKTEIWTELLKNGRPIQYSYLEEDLNLNEFQTVFASQPWAIEMPSAGRPLSWNLLQNLLKKGVKIATLTHAAGISSTGLAELDAILPLPERSDISQKTVDLVNETKAKNNKVIAVGTTVVRALEGRFYSHGELKSGVEITDLRIHNQFKLNVVDALLSGLHDPSESHFELMRAFASEVSLKSVFNEAEKRDFLCHEFGDSILVFKQ